MRKEMTQEEADTIAHHLRDEYRKHQKGLPSEWCKHHEVFWKRDPKDWAWLNEKAIGDELREQDPDIDQDTVDFYNSDYEGFIK